MKRNTRFASGYYPHFWSGTITCLIDFSWFSQDERFNGHDNYQDHTEHITREAERSSANAPCYGWTTWKRQWAARLRDIYTDIENTNIFNLISEWETRDHLNDYLNSDTFSVLLGTMGLLQKPIDIHILTVSGIEGIEAVYTARKAEGISGRPFTERQPELSPGAVRR